MKLKLKKDKLLRQKKIYFMLLVLLIVGICIGLALPKFLTREGYEILKTSISTFFNNVQNNQIDYASGLKNSLLGNISFMLGIWLLGISVIGLPVVLFLLFYKGFVFGFSISSILSVYGFKGILGAFTYVFPGTVLALITTILLSFYSISFSIHLFKYLFLKENLNFKRIMNRYFKILAISLISFIIVSLSDVYLAPILMKIFTFFIK